MVKCFKNQLIGYISKHTGRRVGLSVEISWWNENVSRWNSSLVPWPIDDQVLSGTTVHRTTAFCCFAIFVLHSFVMFCTVLFFSDRCWKLRPGLTKQSERLFGGSIGSGPTMLIADSWLVAWGGTQVGEKISKSGNTMGGKVTKHDKEVILTKFYLIRAPWIQIIWKPVDIKLSNV